MALRVSPSSLLLLVVVSSGCAKTGSPAGPSSGGLPPLGLACPATVVTESLTGAPVTASYESPTQDPPIDAQFTCAPESGTAFPVGTNTVTCTVTNTKQPSSCDFLVFVKAPPKLNKTRFVAFGDSITDGFLRFAPEFFGPAGDPISYPFRLQALLDARYQTQATLVINEGLGGETAAEGANRLPRVLGQDRPDALLILEGLNQLHNLDPVDVSADLRRMVRAGKGSGAAVLLATLTPVSLGLNAERPGLHQKIIELNSLIFDVAHQENIGEPVDLYAAFGSDGSLIGSDGEHPTEAGYQLIAQTFFDRIHEDFEILQTPTVAPTAVASSIAHR